MVRFAAYHPPSKGCANRLFEWVAALCMFQTGLLTTLQYIAGGRPILAFGAFSQLGFTPFLIAMVFTAVGAVRIVALYLNGSWEFGAQVRAVCAVIGMLLWSQLLFGVAELYFATGEIYVSAALWDSLILGEYISLQRAILDIRRKPKDPDLSTHQ